MKVGIWIKIVLGLILVAALIVLCIRLTDMFVTTITDMLSGKEFIDESGDYQLYTPEPMPTMPDYIGDDSFYDNAGSVDFGDE